MKLSTAAVGLFALALFSCKQKPAEQTPAKPITIADNGVNIAYSDTGKGDTTLLFVHGWAINRGYWAGQVAYFKNKYRVVTIDMPGFGESGKNRKDWSTAAYGRDIDSVLMKLDLKKVVLIGHSMAGDIVLQAAAGNPDRVIGLVGVDNFKGVGIAPTAADIANFKKAIDEMKHNFKKVAVQYFNEDLFSKTTADSIKKRILADVAKVDTTIAVASMEAQDFKEVPALRKANKKLYLISSDVTPTDTTQLVKQKIPYQIKYIHGVGHYPMVETPQEFNKDLEQILKSL